MTDTRPTALLAGATGLVGGYLFREITGLTRPEGGSVYRRITVLGRRPMREALGTAVPPSADIEVNEAVVDFSQLHRRRDALAADHIFCALGTTLRRAGSRDRFRTVDVDYPLTLARLAAAGGARHFSLVSSTGADPRARSFYLRVKGELEEAVERVAFPSVTIVRPSVIGGPRGERRPLETVAKWVLAHMPGRLRTVQARDIAACMVRLALDEKPGVTVVESEDIPASQGRR